MTTNAIAEASVKHGSVIYRACNQVPGIITKDHATKGQVTKEHATKGHMTWDY